LEETQTPNQISLIPDNGVEVFIIKNYLINHKEISFLFLLKGYLDSICSSLLYFFFLVIRFAFLHILLEWRPRRTTSPPRSSISTTSQGTCGSLFRVRFTMSQIGVRIIPAAMILSSIWLAKMLPTLSRLTILVPHGSILTSFYWVSSGGFQGLGGVQGLQKACV